MKNEIENTKILENEDTAPTNCSSLDDFLDMDDVSNRRQLVIVKSLNKTFEISAMTNKQYRGYNKQATAMQKKGVDFNFGTLEMLIVINHVVSPNFKDAAFLSKVNCTTAEEFMLRKFDPAAFSDLYEAITKLSGFDKDIDELVEEAKNS